MIRLIFYALLFGAIYYAVKGLFGGSPSRRTPSERGEDSSEGDTMIICPECGTYFPKEIGVLRRVGGKKYLFCGEECAQAFRVRGGPPRDGRTAK